MPFPDLAGVRAAANINLDAAWERWARARYYTVPNPSPALTPSVAERFLRDLHASLSVEWSWGSYLENRSNLWRGGYMARDRAFIHTGVDFNVKAGTPVHADSPGEIILVDHDIGEVGGWGTRVVVRLFHHPVVLIYAHLSPGPEYGEGATLVTGQRFATVGRAIHNGGWFPHLHLQAVTCDAWEYFYPHRMRELDGYGRKEDLALIMARFPDPMPFIRLP